MAEARAETVRGVRRYGLVFGAPGVAPVLATGFLARLPMGMTSLALILVVRDAGGSYAAAGLVTAVNAVAFAAVAPVLGRLTDRLGPKRVLVPAALLGAAALAALAAAAAADAPLAALAGLAAVAGAANPPIGAVVRALWGRILDADLREIAYALEAGLQELFFITGPLVVAAVAALAGPVEAVLAIAALTVLGTLAFAGTQPVRGWAVAGERRTRGAGAVAAPGIRTLVAATLLLGAAFGAAEVAMPAFTEEHGSREAGGIALAAYALGSMLGGLVVASLAPSPRLGQRFAVAVALVGMLLVPLAAAPSIAAVTALALVAGLPIAPAFAFSYRLVDRLAPPGTATEAFAWISTAIVAGVSAGAPLGGGAISAAGPHAAFLLAAACAGAAAVVAAARRGSLA